MTKSPKRVALYLRVSTGDQSVAAQERELCAAAERHGWKIVQVFKDEGISGSKGRDQRPAFDALCKGIARKDFDLVAAWSVDRLGRSLQHLVAFLGDLQGKSDLYLHVQGLDTSTPSGRAMFQMLGVFAEFDRAMITDRVRSGMAKAKAEGKELGRPKTEITPKLSAKIMKLRKSGLGINKIAKELGIGNNIVQSVVAS